MLKELTLLALCAVVCFLDFTQAQVDDPKIMTNPPGYGSYKCPKNYKKRNIDYANRKHYTFMIWGSMDKPLCALKGVPKRGVCKKPLGKKYKYWATFLYGHGEFHIHKFDHFSDMDSGSGSSDPSRGPGRLGSRGGGGKGGSGGNSQGPRPSGGGSGGVGSFSNTKIPQYFAIRAFYFRIRGAYAVTIMFGSKDISKTVTIGGRALDWRKKTWICIMWETFPKFESIWITIKFNRYQKAKLWDLYAFACCEILSSSTFIGGKK